MKVNPENTSVRARFDFVCRKPDGTERWRESSLNVVTTAGKNDLLDKYFAGSGYTAAWYLGLIDASGYTAVNAADTMSSHAGWSEATQYDEAARLTLAWNSASSGSKSSDGTAKFTINATKTIKGCFVTTGSAKSGTSGVLYNAVAFSSDRGVVDNDELTVTVTFGV